MKIDGCEKGYRAIAYYLEGRNDETNRMEDEIIQDIAETGIDHCSCPMKNCRWHGKCYECITLHRAHRDHLPCCMWDLVRERVADPNGLTDHKIKEPGSYPTYRKSVYDVRKINVEEEK